MRVFRRGRGNARTGGKRFGRLRALHQRRAGRRGTRAADSEPPGPYYVDESNQTHILM
jgi:hypothetical protein